MTNKELVRSFQLMSSLLEIHGENTFKARSYKSTAIRIDNISEELSQMGNQQRIDNGLSAGMSDKINDLVETGSFQDLDSLLSQTPEGVLQMLSISGLGAKKIRQIWTELEIENVQELHKAAKDGRLEQAKGFGKKTAEKIAAQISFLKKQTGKERINIAHQYAKYLLKNLESLPEIEKVSLSGQIRMHEPLVDEVLLVASTENSIAVHRFLDNLDGISQYRKSSSPFCWRGIFDEIELKIAVHLTDKEKFAGKLLRESATEAHLNYFHQGRSLLEMTYQNAEDAQTEKDIYHKLNFQEVIPPMRNGLSEWETNVQPSQILQLEDLVGCIHNHSTYSDGKNTVEEMALAAQELGHKYLVMSDHSQSAFYANGLSPERVRKQWKEIDEINQKNQGFRVFKGIETDILADGSLDYDEQTLAGFEVVIASVHSSLNMSKEKATKRLLRAIQNPYTHILGHPTGRLLLRREGYPIDHRQIIEACATHGVAIEINANPYRLDLDWKWIDYALNCNVWICISPDAHNIKGLEDSRWGVMIAQKGGLTREKTLNTLSVEHFSNWLQNKSSSKR